MFVYHGTIMQSSQMYINTFNPQSIPVAEFVLFSG